MSSCLVFCSHFWLCSVLTVITKGRGGQKPPNLDYVICTWMIPSLRIIRWFHELYFDFPKLWNSTKYRVFKLTDFWIRLHKIFIIRDTTDPLCCIVSRNISGLEVVYHAAKVYFSFFFSISFFFFFPYVSFSVFLNNNIISRLLAAI